MPREPQPGRGGPEFVPDPNWMPDLIRRLRSHPQDDSQFVADCLAEIDSGVYRGKLIGSDDPNIQGVPLAVRLVTMHEGQLVAPVLVVSGKPKDEKRTYERMKSDIERLEGMDFSPFEEPARGLMEAAGLRTLAGYILYRDPRTSRTYGEVAHPRAYRGLASRIGEQFSDMQRDLGASGMAQYLEVPRDFVGVLGSPSELMMDELGAGIATHFLKSTPFGNGEGIRLGRK